MKLILLSLVLVLFTLTTKSQSVIDSLTTFQPVVRAEGTSGGGTVENESPAPVPDPSYLGSRSLYARADNARLGDEVSTRAVAGGLQCNIASGTKGVSEWRYSSISNVDLLSTGCGCFALTEVGPDKNHKLKVTTKSGGTSAVSTSPILPALPGAERLVCIPIEAPFAAYESVTNLVLQVDGTIQAQFDVDLTQFCCVTPTTAWHTIAPGPYTVGSCTDLTLNIRSYVRLPAANEDFTYSFSMNGLGTVTGGSLSCTNGVSGTIDGGSGSISGGGTLADGISSTCSFEVCWTTSGMNDFSASINSSRIGNSYNSNADVDPFNDSDPYRKCQPNTPSTITVVEPPSTTTPPSTTKPPTSAPQTTELPTTHSGTLQTDSGDTSSVGILHVDLVFLLMTMMAFVL